MQVVSVVETASARDTSRFSACPVQCSEPLEPQADTCGEREPPTPEPQRDEVDGVAQLSR